MIIIPAIDLINGQCVRLEKGDFESVKRYEVSPLEVIRTYEQAGSNILHVVDLDGAKKGSITQLKCIQSICESTAMAVQVGGGIRSLQDAKRLFATGVSRIIIGSLSVKNRAETKKIFEKFGGEKVVLALDVHINAQGEAMVATQGWQDESTLSLDEAIHHYQPQGLQHVLCTDISCDGMLQGANVALYQRCVAEYPEIAFQASGGVGTLQDLKELKQTGVSSVIVGKALYEKRFELSEAIQYLEQVVVC